MDRSSKRRQIKAPETLLHIDDIGESSDDSDFRIEDHCLDESDSSENSQISSNTSNDDSQSEDSDTSIEKKKDLKPKNGVTVFFDEKLLLDTSQIDDEVLRHVLICCVCLGDRSDDTNEIIECDGCGITVHEGCYGVQDTASVSSTVSSCSTEPWFCEACRAGVENPTCELCPNFGGIFKETDIGKWVHLVCALYIPGIAFGDPDKLSNVTLFEISSSKWGNRACQLCQDNRFVRTGLTIECDAGMCRAFFHVTCGQREGLLSEATTEEVEQADPFYAHCKLHSDKNHIKQRRRNWLALQLRTQKMTDFRNKEISEETFVWKRNQRKLSKYRMKYSQMKAGRVAPWVPLQKRPRLLTTSASACRTLWLKSELMGVDMASFEETEALISTLQDIPKKWNIPPAFSVEFIGYFLDRDARVNRLKKQLSHHAENKARLTSEQQKLQQTYDTAITGNAKMSELNGSMKQTIQLYHDIILRVKPKITLPAVENIARPVNNMSVLHEDHYPLAFPRGKIPTAAALKAGVGYPLRLPCDQPFEEEKMSVELNNKCGICYKSNDQHLLTKCDTCGKYYHLGCLDPPLTRMPKKTKLMGWQCSECDKESSSSDMESVDTEAPRKLRRSSKDRDFPTDEFFERRESYEGVNDGVEIKKNKKRRRDKHRARYSPDFVGPHNPGKHHSRKRKHQSLDPQTGLAPPRQGIKLFIKTIPNSSGQANFVATQSPSTTSTFVAKTEEYVKDSPETEPNPPKAKRKSVAAASAQGRCDTCNDAGSSANMVSCDECAKCFHFHCLDPPVKKSPKVRGYSWHCANCDPTESDSD